MKHPFIIVHDYQTGGVLARVFANSRAEVEALLPSPTWKVYEPEEPGCENVPVNFKIMESDIYDQEPWLQNQIYICAREAEGKTAFPVRGNSQGVVEYRDVWARSAAEVRMRFPTLEFLYGVVLTSKELDDMGNSDIDEIDDFLAKYERLTRQ